MFITYNGKGHTKFKDCQTEAAKIILSFLLANRPLAVHLHGNTLKDISRVREAARVVALAVGSSSQLDIPPRERPQPSRLAAGSPQTFTPDAEIKLREFMAAVPDDTYDPTRCPSWMWTVFRESLPKGGLKPFLQTLPQVEILEESQGRWKFRTGPPAPPATGGTPGAQTYYGAAAPTPPATGGTPGAQTYYGAAAQAQAPVATTAPPSAPAPGAAAPAAAAAATAPPTLSPQLPSSLPAPGGHQQ